jgi:hypothetical protein
VADKPEGGHGWFKTRNGYETTSVPNGPELRRFRKNYGAFLPRSLNQVARGKLQHHQTIYQPGLIEVKLGAGRVTPQE